MSVEPGESACSGEGTVPWPKRRCLVEEWPQPTEPGDICCKGRGPFPQPVLCSIGDRMVQIG